MPGSPVLLDTNGWLALLNATDELHATANAVWRQLGRAGRPILLTDLIVAETGNGLARTPARARFSAAVQRLASSPRVGLHFVDRELLARGTELYADRPDKTWGLVDCVSFVVMRDHDATEAFTSDKHFEQAGFIRLLPTHPGE